MVIIRPAKRKAPSLYQIITRERKLRLTNQKQADIVSTKTSRTNSTSQLLTPPDHRLITQQAESMAGQQSTRSSTRCLLASYDPCVIDESSKGKPKQLASENLEW